MEINDLCNMFRQKIETEQSIYTNKRSKETVLIDCNDEDELFSLRLPLPSKVYNVFLYTPKTVSSTHWSFDYYYWQQIIKFLFKNNYKYKLISNGKIIN